MKSLGGGFKTRGPSSTVGSGSGAPRYDAAKSAAPRADPVIPVENAGRTENVVEIASGPERPISKKRKVVWVKPSKAKEPAVKRVVCDDAGKDQDGEPVQIGNFTRNWQPQCLKSPLMRTRPIWWSPD